jgi:hypothetical protein
LTPKCKSCCYKARRKKARDGVRLERAQADIVDQIRYATTSMRMPAMSPTMTEGGIAGWRKKEGETFTAGDVLLEIVRISTLSSIDRSESKGNLSEALDIRTAGKAICVDQES